MSRPLLLGFATIAAGLALAQAAPAGPPESRGAALAHSASAGPAESRRVSLGQAASAGAAESRRADRDQVKALRLTVDWLTTYPQPLWVGVEMPGRCEPVPSGRRACAIAIRLLAWTRGELAPWRCDAHVLLPAPGSTARVRRTSAHCAPVRAATP